MKSTLILLSFSVLLFSCKGQTEHNKVTKEEMKKGETEMDTNVNQDTNTYKNAKSILELKEGLTIKVNEIAFYTGEVHNSVGTSFSVDFDSTFFKKVHETFDYKYPERSNMDGGDAANLTFYYKALKIGTFDFIIDYRHHDEIQFSDTVKITIIE